MSDMEPPRLKPFQRVSLILELPAMFVAGLVGAVLLPQHGAAWMYLSLPLVVITWYSIGRWVDGLLGYVARLCVPQILRQMLNVIAIFLLAVSIGGLTPLYHHRTRDTYWVFTGFMLWSGLCLAMMFSCPTRPTGKSKSPS